MTTAEQRTELKAFLRSRRAALSPKAVGLPHGQRRLTPGLRREEVAALAGVGVTWYTWLEQGRDIKVSAASAARISAALRLTPSEEAYFFMLAALPHAQTSVTEAQLSTALHDMLELYAAPAFVFDRLLNIIACNRMGGRLYDVQDCEGPFARNHVWNAFLNPARRNLYAADYEHSKGTMLSALRLNQAAYPDDVRFGVMINTLTAASPEFAAAWRRMHVEEPVSVSTSTAETPFAITMAHRDFGNINVHFVHMLMRGVRNDGTIVSQFVPADAETAASFARMARLLRDESHED